MSNVRKARLTLAFLLAPASPVLVFYFFILPKSLVLILGFPLSYAATAIAGVPLFFRARKKGQVTRNDCIQGGFVAGAIVPLLLTTSSLVWRIATSQPIAPFALLWLGVGGAVVYGLYGAIAGYAFSWLAGYKATHPMRDQS